MLVNDGEMLVNDGEMLVNDGEMSVWSFTHFTIIDEHFTIISLKLTIIRSFDHHWEAAPTVLKACRLRLPTYPKSDKSLVIQRLIKAGSDIRLFLVSAVQLINQLIQDYFILFCFSFCLSFGPKSLQRSTSCPSGCTWAYSGGTAHDCT